MGSGPISISLGLLTLVRARRSPEACDACACVNLPTHIRCVCFLACACVCARSALWHAVCVSLPVCALRTVVYVCVCVCVCTRVCVCVLVFVRAYRDWETWWCMAVLSWWMLS